MSRYRYRYSAYFYAAVLTLLLVVAAAFFYRTYFFPAATAPVAQFGGVSLKLEFATTTPARVQGLSGRESIPKDYGMLFAFKKSDLHGFWMKDMLIPIDIFWLDDKGQVVTIAHNVSPTSYPRVFYPQQPVRYVLETAAGFAKAHNISEGAILLLQNFPSVSE